jgi:hypothetical protein
VDKKLIEKTDEALEKKLEEGLNTNNLEIVYKLKKINHMAKEDENMYGEYGNYGRRPGYDSYGRGSYGNYGEYGNYGRRGYDMKYRGDEEMDRMAGEYGRYQESRSRYGANSEEVDKSFHYMVKALEDFIMVLKEEAESPAQKQQLMQALQNSMR